MAKKRAITIAILLAAIGAIIPLLITIYLSWFFAIRNEQKSLQKIGTRALARVESTLIQIQGALDQLKKQPFTPCSAEHIQLMRTLTINTRSIEEIGYFNHGVMQCTSWGVTTKKVQLIDPDFILPNGLKINNNVIPLISSDSLMTSVYSNHYGILVNPQNFVDALFDSRLKLVIMTTSGNIIGTFGTPDIQLIKRLFKTEQQYINDFCIIGFAQKSGLISAVIAPRNILDRRLSQQKLILLPFGIVIAAVFITLIFWLLKHRLSPLGELTIAVENSEFKVFYQPIVELTSGRCVGAEALIKWCRPNGEIIQPDFFIPLAEESGLISPITDQVIQSVVREMKSILNTDRSLHIAINLCVDDIQSGRFLPIINNALSNTGILPNQIWLEATERGFMDIPKAQETINQARILGYIVAIDDFGTGYSSLSTLQNFSLHILKIDKTFVDKIGTNSVVSEVTSHIIDIARTLKLDIVAEGIESSLQANYLAERQVKYGQGWLYSKALIASEFIDYYCRNRLELS